MLTQVLVWSARMLMLPTITKVSTTFFAVEKQDKILFFTSVEQILRIFSYFLFKSIIRKIHIFKTMRLDNGTS